MGNKNQALLQYQFSVHDLHDKPITSGLRVAIYTAGSTAATVYADKYATALTNPITATVFAAAGGLVEFWYGGPTCDVAISDGIGRLIKIEGLTPSTKKVTWDPNQAVAGVMGNISGTDLADVSGTFVDYANTVTLDGSLLRAGDIVKIGGWLVIDDFHSTEELDFKVEAIDGTNDPLLLHTGDMVPAADNDYLRFDVTLKVLTAGESGKVIWSGQMFTNLNGTVALLNGTVEDGISLAGSTLDLSGDIVLTASGDYATAHADQESQVIWDVQVIKGIVV